MKAAMAETTPDLRHLSRPEAYRELSLQLGSVLAGVRDEVTAMATVSCLVHHAFGHLWTGFYRVVEPGKLLRVGPYQGTLGCLEIEFGRGVCGEAAAKRETIIVDDVGRFPGHIACDGRALSEIVVPVFNAKGELAAVFDVDSAARNTFDQADRSGLEQLLRWFRE